MILSFQSWQMLTSPWFLMLTRGSVFYATDSDKFHSSKTDISFCWKAKKKKTHKRYVIIWYFVRIVCFIMMTAAGQPFYICEVLSYFSWSHLILREGLTCLLPTSQVKKIEASKKWQSCPPRSSESTWNPMLQFPVHGCCKKNPLLENISYNYCISHLCKLLKELSPKCMFSMMEISFFLIFISFSTGG